ncbi:ROK family protein [Parapedobacter tibetensis]|uniref:ROK family protein n=1 Tax=Parapedobacter tibetensis TaxID=2972951 RepID=UPI00214D38B3|nr:ROK family protein [Parapedobacter tibetensis]
MESFFLGMDKLDGMSKMEKKNYSYKIKLVRGIIEKNGMTNADICRHLNISSPKSLALINELIVAGILEQKEKAGSIGGRRPVLNTIKNESLLILCIEIERFKVKLTIVDNNNRLKSTQSHSFLLSKNQSSIPKLHELIVNFIAYSELSWNRIVGIGISMPGLVNHKEGKNYTYLVNSDGEDSLQERISKHFNKPVFIINDVKCAAIAEHKFGLAKNKQDVLVILMDWGIGLGVITDGELMNGTAGFSGEMGHMPFVEDGTLCYCGKKGCLETVASGIALARMAKEGIQSGQDSLLNALSDREIENIEPHLVINAANQGDQYAISILSYLGEKLGKGIATLIQLFNPELIILGGKIAEAKEYITIPIQQSINTYCMQPIRDIVKVELSQLGAEAGAMGAARVFLDQLFNEQIAYVER